MKEISVIIPLHEVNSTIEAYFENAVKSVEEQFVRPTSLVIVTPKGSEAYKFATSFDYKGVSDIVKVIENDGRTDFSSQVNFAVSQCETPWFSVLEFDDEYSKIWFKNVDKYSKIYKDINCFLPIVVDVTENGQFAGFTNEATFAVNISSEMGILTNETLLSYQNFQISGLVIKRSSFVDFGLLKPSFKLTFGYELFLRLTHNSVKIMTIPRIGYKHTNLRQGSIFWDYKNGDEVLSKEEIQFWIDSAKKESFFLVDRAIKYQS